MSTRRAFLRTLLCASAAPSVLALRSRDADRDPGALFEECPVFVSGVGYPFYRIPAVLATRRSTLLAFAEGRQTLGDHSQNDLVVRRSRDRGRSWEPVQMVARDRPNVLVNPTVVEVHDTGRVWLMYQRYPAGFHERAVVPGYEDPRVCRTFVLYSDDEGDTWSTAREITREVKHPEGVTSTACGPGIGIELRRGDHRGRLVVPFNEGPAGAWKVYAAYSDDRGETWHYGRTAPDSAKGTANEVQVVELADGRLMLNARSMGGGHCRKVAFSADGGRSWSPLADEPALPDPECQATILRYDWPRHFSRGRLLFANPASGTDRVNGTVRLSDDEGRTSPVSRVVYPGAFAYSCLTVLGDGSVGLLYERDEYRAITFARFNLAWLFGGRASSPGPGSSLVSGVL